MALEDYTLLTLRTKLADEFGLDKSEATVAAILDNYINKAQQHIVKQRPNWPWLETSTDIDVAAPVSTTCDVLQGSRTFSNFGVDPALRDIVTTQTAGSRPSEGFLVVASATPNATVVRQYTGTTTVGLAVRIVKAYFQLPADFIRMIGSPILGDSLADPNMRYLAPNKFDRLARQTLSATSLDQFYTVLIDPLVAEANRYLGIYPFLAELNSIHLRYYQDVAVLSADGDIPTVPRSERETIFDVAKWFVAGWQNNSGIDSYRDMALQSISAMLDEFEFVDDPDEGRAAPAGLNFIIGPAGYPSFE